MKIIGTIIASVALVLSGFVAAPALAEDGATQVCWADPADPQLIHHPRMIESDADDDDLGGMIVRPFPNNAYGCASYDGEPLQEWESLYVNSSTAPSPVAQSCESEQVDYWRAAYERADAAGQKYLRDYIVLGKLVDRQNAKVDRQRATIKRQRAAIQKLRAQLLGR